MMQSSPDALRSPGLDQHRNGWGHVSERVQEWQAGGEDAVPPLGRIHTTQR